MTDRSKSHCFELFCAGNEVGWIKIVSLFLTSEDADYCCVQVIKACKTDSEGKVVEGKHTVYRMSASTEEEKDEWIKCIQ